MATLDILEEQIINPDNIPTLSSASKSDILDRAQIEKISNSPRLSIPKEIVDLLNERIKTDPRLKVTLFDITESATFAEARDHVEKSSVLLPEDKRKILDLLPEERVENIPGFSEQLDLARSKYAEELFKYTRMLDQKRLSFSRLITDLGTTRDMSDMPEPSSLVLEREIYMRLIKDAEMQSGEDAVNIRLNEIERFREEFMKLLPPKQQERINKALSLPEDVISEEPAVDQTQVSPNNTQAQEKLEEITQDAKTIFPLNFGAHKLEVESGNVRGKLVANVVLDGVKIASGYVGEEGGVKLLAHFNRGFIGEESLEEKAYKHAMKLISTMK